MMYGWTGTNLEIDLSQGEVKKTENDLRLNEDYLGGRGVDTKLLWDRVPAEVSPFSSQNLLIFGTGVLTGTLAPGTNRTIITTRSPQTNLLTYSSMGGFWAPELKHAGYDRIIISGKSSAPVYLWINDDRIEIRDASHLWGKDVRETQRIIREELKNNKVQSLCIGPAGENRVAAASIEHSTGASASRSVGAVMGDKRIKAVAVYGTKDVNISKPSAFIETCEGILKKTGKLKTYYENWSYEVAGSLINVGAYGNLGQEMPIENAGKLHADFVEKLKTRSSSCYNCGMACKIAMSLPDGEYSFVKCQSWFLFMFATKIQDLDFNLKCYNLCEKYGLDTISTSRYIGFAIDLYEKGILNKADTEGLDLEWGNKDVALSLIEKIARREGIGAVLANGVYEAARQIGKGAEEYAYHNKKLELAPYALDAPQRALRAVITDKADLTRAGSGILRNALSRPKEWKEAYLKSGFFPYPKELEKNFLGDITGSVNDYEEFIPIVSYDVDRYTLCDCTGLCIYWAGFWLYNPILPIDHLNLISYATGMDFDETESITIAKRIGALNRGYNVMLGIRRDDDTVPERYFRESSSNRFLDREKFNRMLDSAYKLMGWNSEGIPSKEELDRLGLDYVRRELEQRGIF
jgi:aldehyde:ferredoxin oxidoreductase